MSSIPVRSCIKNVQQENFLCHNTYCTFLFFDNDFDNVIRLGLSEKNVLGWSSTFMNEGIALFLLLLYKGEVLPKGLETMIKSLMCRCSFNTSKFFEGTNLHGEESEVELFWELFCKWREVVDISEEKYNEWIQMLEKYISSET